MATTTSRCSSPRTDARATAAAERGRAGRALLRPHAAHRRAGVPRAPARRRRGGRGWTARGGPGRRARYAPADRRKVARAAGGHAAGARRAGPGLRGEVRHPVRRLRRRTRPRGARAGAARAPPAHARRGADDRAARAGRDREGPVDPYVTEWLDLVFRWLHVVAGIVWIGTSFYFVALDNHLRPAESEPEPADEAWEIHGGGFYRVVKLRGVPAELPRPLYWFKWEAYWTWLSGFALFVVLYYARAGTALVDRDVADLSKTTAVLVSVVLLVAAWIVYDLACRLLAGRELLLLLTIVALVTATSYGVSQLYAPRAAYLQVGAMLGTIMAANVLLVI